MRLIKGSRSLFFILFLLISSFEVCSANEKGLAWFGFGEAEGHYEENFFKIDEEVKGQTYEYNQYRYLSVKNRGIIPSSQGKTKSFFIHYTLFDPEFQDYLDRKHKLNFTEIIPNWSRGYQYTVHLSKKLDMMTSADIFLGLGLITFEKEIERFGNYDHRIGFDLSYGYSMNWLFKWDDQFFLGWRSIVKNNRITLDYGSDEDFGYLTHRRDILFIVGFTFSGADPLCVPTVYVPCTD